MANMDGFASSSSNSSLNNTKHLKEQFVSNLSGSSMLEIVALSVIVPALVVLRQWNAFYTSNDTGLKEKTEDAVPRYKLWRTYMFSLALDFLFVVLPILTFFTVLDDWVYTCALFLLFAIIITLSKRFLSSVFDPRVPHKSSLRPSISSYRVAMMMVTCLCILAVDFKIFPRRYAKAETYGTGLMDLGVGSFVVANSLVSRQARSAISISWKSTIKSTFHLLVLGTIRLLTTAGVDYQVHVGEYGVHWNFFFTLAAVSLLTCLINIAPKYCGVFALAILVAYQICLLCGLNKYLLSNDRGLDIISQNKEGIFSIFGYWGMYLAGVYLGYKILFQTELMATKSSPNMTKIRVWGLTILFWVSTVILNEYVEEVSRRMCNLAYVTLVFAQNFQVLAILTLSDLLPDRRHLILEEAFNKNLLGVFLLANILTGLINLCVDTLSASSFEAFCILLGYSGFLSAFAGVAVLCGIRFKFW